MLIVFSPLWRGTRISRSSRPAYSMSSWRKSSSMRPATQRARIGRRRSTFTTRVSESWKCQKSRHQRKNEKTVQPKLYRSLFPHDVFLSGAAFLKSFFVIAHRFCCPCAFLYIARKGMYARETLVGFPLYVKSPARRRPLLRSKSAAPKRKTPVGVSFFLEQGTGIEPASSAWEADVLPMY